MPRAVGRACFKLEDVPQNDVELDLASVEVLVLGTATSRHSPRLAVRVATARAISGGMTWQQKSCDDVGSHLDHRGLTHPVVGARISPRRIAERVRLARRSCEPIPRTTRCQRAQPNLDRRRGTIVSAAAASATAQQVEPTSKQEATQQRQQLRKDPTKRTAATSRPQCDHPAARKAGAPSPLGSAEPRANNSTSAIGYLGRQSRHAPTNSVRDQTSKTGAGLCGSQSIAPFGNHSPAREATEGGVTRRHSGLEL